MRDPINLQKYVLDNVIDKIEQRTNNQDLTLVDPNSVFVHLVESHTSVVSQLATIFQNEIDRRNALRAMTDEDLYLHMSDYDFVGNYATPSQMTLTITMDKNYILTKGVNVNDNYSVLVIPKDMIITIGTLNFGIYYPIELQVDKRTETPMVVYDISEQHPLHALKSNRVNFNEYKYMTYNLLSFDVTAYQFVKTLHTVAISDSDPGYAGSFDYEDKFYAVVIYNVKNGIRTRVVQEQVQDNYDPYTPTARVEVYTDQNRITVSIPTIYFSSGLMGNKLEIEIYTTRGDISVNVGSVPIDQCDVNFNINEKNVTPYNRPLQQVNTLALNIKSTVTTGGSDGYTFEDRRKRIINNSFTTKLLVTPQDLESYYDTFGIKVVRYLDNLTNLIYFAHKALTDEEGNVVPTANTYLQIEPDDYIKTSSIKHSPDGSLTILPKTMFIFDDRQDVCKPVSDHDLEILANQDKESIITTFNNESYVRTPFHIRLNTSITYPLATSYNLMQPKIEDVLVESENVEVAAQMLMVGEKIQHLNDGAGGFKVTIAVKKDIMDDIPESDIFVWVYCFSVEETLIGIQATHTNSESNYSTYEFMINTDYYIDDDGNINTTSLKAYGSTLNHRISLTTDFTIVFMANSKNFPNTSTALSLYNGVPVMYQADMTVLLRQKFTVNLGHHLKDVIYNSINLTKTNREVMRYEIDIPNTYENDVYLLDEAGDPVVEVRDGKVVLTKLHEAGDIERNEKDEIVYKHHKGDIILDERGNPRYTTERSQIYQIMAPVVSANMYVSENIIQVNFRSKIVELFETYFQAIRDSIGYLSERTKVYFRPARTLGNTTYSLGDGVTVINPLELSFSFRITTSDTVVASKSIKSSIENIVAGIIRNHLNDTVISQTDIAKEIKDTIDYVISIDCLGINGIMDMQTVTVIDNAVQPALRKELYLTSDEEISMRYKIDIEYIAK